MYDLSIIVPSIRPHYWKRYYESVVNSCAKYNWEIVFVGPFCDQEILANNTIKNVRYFKDYATTTVCAQM